MQYYDNPWEDPEQNPYTGGIATADGDAPGGMPGTPGNPNTGTNPDAGDVPPVSTPATPTATTDPWTVAPTDGNWEAWFRRNLGRPTLSPAELIALEGKLNQAGVKVLRNASGVAGKVQLPSGQTVDVIQRAGAGGNTFQWLTGSGSAGGGPVDLGSIAIDPSYLQPWTGSAPRMEVPSFQSPGEFHAPNEADLFADPSFKFRMSQGQGALENSAAAHGVLNSGGTLTDILNYGQKAASQEYGNVFDRNFGLWNANWNNALGKFRADESASNDAYQRAWNAYTDARDSFYQNQSGSFDKLFRVAQLGAGTAQSS